jgi:hypothetical protein
MRTKKKKQARFYASKNQSDGQLSVQDIRQMIEDDQSGRLAQRVSRAANTVEGTHPFWSAKSAELTAMIRDPDCGTPSVFFTVSSAVSEPGPPDQQVEDRCRSSFRSQL